MLEYEPRAADQVPLLLRMEQWELAVIKAVDSGDTDLGTCAAIARSAQLCGDGGICAG